MGSTDYYDNVCYMGSSFSHLFPCQCATVVPPLPSMPVSNWQTNADAHPGQILLSKSKNFARGNQEAGAHPNPDAEQGPEDAQSEVDLLTGVDVSDSNTVRPN